MTFMAYRPVSPRPFRPISSGLLTRTLPPDTTSQHPITGAPLAPRSPSGNEDPVYSPHGRATDLAAMAGD
jgi:hypothetical protein